MTKGCVASGIPIIVFGRMVLAKTLGEDELHQVVVQTKLLWGSRGPGVAGGNESTNVCRRAELEAA